MSTENRVFQIDDLRQYIFLFLRSRKTATICSDCQSVLVWDKKITDYVTINKKYFFGNLPKGYYCLKCYSKYVTNICNIC